MFGAAEKVLVPEDMHQFGPDYAKTLQVYVHVLLRKKNKRQNLINRDELELVQYAEKR